MVDYPEWMKEDAKRMAADRSSVLLRTMNWAAVLLISIDAHIEEREELMRLANDVSKLNFWRSFKHSREQLGMTPDQIGRLKEQNIKMREPEMTEDERLSRISEIEMEFKKLCVRNAIVPDEPAPEEMPDNVKQVCLKIQRSREPIELRLNNLQGKIDQIMESLPKSSGADLVTGSEKLKHLAGENKRLMQLFIMISFLGPDAVDLDEFVDDQDHP